MFMALDIWRDSAGVFVPREAVLAPANASIFRGLIPSGHSGIQSPQPLQLEAHTSEAVPSPSPRARKSMMPPPTRLAGSPAAAPNGTTGPTSTHFPHRV